jgi:flagellar biogenesis protein FliO
MEEAGSESEKLAKYATRMILVVIGVWFAAYVIAKLLILFF